MRPIVHELEAEYWGKVDFVYLDRESAANRDVVEQYGIFGQPIFILIQPDGSEIQRWFGTVDLDAVRQALDAVQTS
jgi:thioredoxin-like negative regulator of GroEL